MDIEWMVHAVETKRWWLYWLLVIGWIFVAANIVTSTLLAVVYAANIEAGTFSELNISQETMKFFVPVGYEISYAMEFIVAAGTIAVILITLIGINYYNDHREPARSLKHKIARWALLLLALSPVIFLIVTAIYNPDLDPVSIIFLLPEIIVILIGKLMGYIGMFPLP